MGKSKDSFSKDQMQRYENQGIQAKETTDCVQRAFGWREVSVKLPDGRTGSGVEDSVSEAATSAERNAISKPKK